MRDALAWLAAVRHGDRENTPCSLGSLLHQPPGKAIETPMGFSHRTSTLLIQAMATVWCRPCGRQMSTPSSFSVESISS